MAHRNSYLIGIYIEKIQIKECFNSNHYRFYNMVSLNFVFKINAMSRQLKHNYLNCFLSINKLYLNHLKTTKRNPIELF